MNANLNMNSYCNRQYQTSGDIRRAYLANSRKAEAVAFIKKALADKHQNNQRNRQQQLCARIQMI